MHTYSKRSILFAIALSALAGYVDAIGFLQLGGYFVSFMSGNSTQFAVAVVHHNAANILLLAKIILLFVLGAMGGMITSRLAPPSKQPFAVLLLVTLLLTGAAFAHIAGFLHSMLALMILAMGAENAIFQRSGEVAVGLTYMTGTLVKLGHHLANLFFDTPNFSWFPHLLLWCGLVTGGITGALLFHAIGLASLWGAALWAALLTGITHSIPTING